MKKSHPGTPVAVALLLALAILAGCRPGRPQAVPPTAPTRPPLPEAGVFQGEWCGGPRVYYAIEHPLDGTPVVTVPANQPGRLVEITNVCRDGRILSFEQIDYDPAGDDTAPADDGATIRTTRWAVSLQVSMYDYNRVLMQIRRAEATTGVQRLLSRHLRPSDFSHQTNALSTNGAAPCP